MSAPVTLQLLLSRAREALSGAIDFDKPYSAAAAPAILDVMGGIAEAMGSDTCKLPLDRQAAVLVQPRDDREIQIFSFDEFDAHRPFTLRMPVDRLGAISLEQLHEELKDPNRRWAGDALAEVRSIIPRAGMNVVMSSDIPANAGVGRSAAMQVAMARAMADLAAGNDEAEPIAQQAINAHQQVLGRKGFVSSRLAAAGGATFHVPKGFEFSAIVGVKRAVDAAERIKQHLAAAASASAAILDRMRQMGRAAGRELIHDPLSGQLARLDPDDYKALFRPYLSDPAVMGAADHHVLEARRVRQFQQFMAEARQLELGDIRRHTSMDKAGHLMYASHHSMMNDARLGDDRCDWIVQQVRASEKSGLYGARMSGAGCGGAVAVLHEAAPRPREVVRDIARRAAVQFEAAIDVLTPPDAA
jgi:galactokinase